MARLSLLLVAVCLLVLPTPGRSDDLSPLLNIAASIFQNMNPRDSENFGGMINDIVAGLIQSGGSNLDSAPGQDNANGKANNAGNLLSTLGSLLGGQDGKIDPSMIGSMVSMFSQLSSNKEPGQGGSRQKRQNNGNDFNMESILSMASGLLGNQNTAGFLPMIMNTLNSFSDNEVQKRSDDHKDHSSFLPPFFEKIHLYWDLFINSELGKTVWEKSGFKRAMKSFTGPDGKISFEVMMKNFENQSFRRHWIKAAAQWLTEMVVHIAKPEVYQKYMMAAEYMINSFLDGRGVPSNIRFNMKRPEESITKLVNQALKTNLDMEDADVSEYVKPAVDYVKEILKLAEKASKSLGGDYNAVADRLTDTLNLEVIEPVLRVYRAYRHSLAAPHCQEHLMCLVNRHHDKDKQGLPGFKAALTKLSSMAASAALSFQNGKGFFDLYNAIQEDVNCDAKYPADCAAFHEHEMKVTTEIYHSEL